MRSGAELKALVRGLPARRRRRTTPTTRSPRTSPGREAWEKIGRRYKAPAPIPATAKKPLFVAGLKPQAGGDA